MRVAIAFHRAKRLKALIANPLGEAPGIGPTRKRALPKCFGTANAPARAGFTDLEKAPGCSTTIANAIYHYLHGGNGS